MGGRLIEEIENIKKEVVDMGFLALKLLNEAVESLKLQDMEKVEYVLSKKGDIAKMDEDIEEKTLRLIALYHPVAKDLRTVGSILKMITYIARVGRYAKDIAKTAKLLSDKPHISKLVEIPYMANVVSEMIRDALLAFRDENAECLKEFGERDDEVDSLYYSIFRECLTYMMEDTKKITRCMHYIIITRYLERCGDHACKIAEKVHYMLTGEHVEIR